MGYSALAKVYDKLMNDFDYDGYYNAVKGYISGAVVELAIGSGEFTKRYIDKVTNLVGVDYSTEMLGVCSSKLTRYRRKCVLVNDDLASFSPQYSVDTVLCVCDGLNYTSDILAVADKVRQYLKPNGYFIFDISSAYKLRNVLGDNTFYEEENDICYVWQNFLDENVVDMQVTIFAGDGSGKYAKSYEEQRQYIHEGQSVIVGLKNMGYNCIVLDGESFQKPQENSNRLLFILDKN